MNLKIWKKQPLRFTVTDFFFPLFDENLTVLAADIIYHIYNIRTCTHSVRVSCAVHDVVV